MITGGIKFFDPNLADSDAGGSATASSGDSSAGFILDRNSYTYYRSVGSDDTITETIEITLDMSHSFDRLFLLDHNFKQFVVKWFDGAVYQDFSNVTGINGVETSTISETVWSEDSSYYEFDSVTTNMIKIEVLKTQVVDNQKYLNSFVCCPELGTLEGFPQIGKVTKNKNIRKSKVLNGRSFITKSLETIAFKLKYKNYPPVYEDDLDLMFELFDRDLAFLVWLCGGRTGAPYFKYQFPGFNLKDLIEMQITKPFKDSYTRNFYNGGVNMSVSFEESA